ARAPSGNGSALTSAAADYYFLEHTPAVSSRLAVPSAPSVESNNSYQGFKAPLAVPPRTNFDIHAVRRDFPILQERVNGKRGIHVTAHQGIKADVAFRDLCQAHRFHVFQFAQRGFPLEYCRQVRLDI
ncbi:MAG TPA: hypothetical protein PLQ32_14115, partial [Flavihumibacter sp.]|nr:hypothetical protein [Flavihumibacter sp.]